LFCWIKIECLLSAAGTANTDNNESAKHTLLNKLGTSEGLLLKLEPFFSNAISQIGPLSFYLIFLNPGYFSKKDFDE